MQATALNKMNKYFISNYIIKISIVSLFVSFFSIDLVLYGGEGDGAVFLKAGLISLPIILDAIYSIIFNEKNQILKNDFIGKLVFPLYIISIYGALSAIWSVVAMDSFVRALSLFMATTSCAICVRRAFEINKNNVCEYIINNIVLAFIVLCGVMYAAYIVNESIFWRDDRLGGEVIPTNTLGAFGGMIFGISIVSIIRTRVINTNFIALILSGFILYYTFSRGAIIAMTASVAVSEMFILLATKNYHKVFMYLWIFLVALCLVELFTDNNSFIAQMLLRENDSVESLKTGTMRTELWKKVFDGIGLNVLWGHGYAMITPEGYVIVENLKTNHAHNGYIQVYAGLGLIGVGFLLSFAIGCFGVLRGALIFDKVSSNFGIFAAFFFMINNFSEASIGYQIYPQLIIFLLIVMSLAKINELNTAEIK